MKLSLTFQPFVKPLYKKYCIDKIQSTVTQIKNHFLFSKKQNIYDPKPFNRKQQSCNDSLDIQQQLNKTVKRTLTHNKKQDNKVNPQKTYSYDFVNNQMKNIPQKQDQRHKQVIKPQQKVNKQSSIEQDQQKNELFAFLKKVQTTMSYHTNFYQNLMQKIKLMNQKQNYLEKFIVQLQNIKKDQKQSSPIKQLEFKSSEYYQSSQSKRYQNFPLSSMTFRRNKSLNYQQTDKCIQNVPDKMGKILQKNEKSKQQQLYKYLMRQTEKYQNAGQKMQKINSQCKQQLKPVYKAQPQAKTSQLVECNTITQNADFLISFMRLQQQFNKIKKKSKFQPNVMNKMTKQQTVLIK